MRVESTVMKVRGGRQCVDAIVGDDGCGGGGDVRSVMAGPDGGGVGDDGGAGAVDLMVVESWLCDGDGGGLRVRGFGRLIEENSNLSSAYQEAMGIVAQWENQALLIA
ncbi:hypothetical protein F0562_001008 [Nyssa sinensis]|uniref:Uncharacterized protein n=1 Tax=Nyssa sinensis TaxID=561372 RepID=A0A5J5C3E2_9ASTE|nr:hypothetical protein F0562_001008 [Nyssa sinensis]